MARNVTIAELEEKTREDLLDLAKTLGSERPAIGPWFRSRGKALETKTEEKTPKAISASTRPWSMGRRWFRAKAYGAVPDAGRQY